MWPWTKKKVPDVIQGLRFRYSGAEILTLYRDRIRRLHDSLEKINRLKSLHAKRCANAPAPCDLDDRIAVIQSNMYKMLDVTEDNLKRFNAKADYMLTPEEYASLTFSPLESLILPEGDLVDGPKSMAN